MSPGSPQQSFSLIFLLLSQWQTEPPDILALLAESSFRQARGSATTAALSKYANSALPFHSFCSMIFLFFLPDVCSWHKYNLKRKIADLAPVNAEQFAQKVLGKTRPIKCGAVHVFTQRSFVAQQSQNREAEERQGLIYECATCRYFFSSFFYKLKCLIFQT